MKLAKADHPIVKGLPAVWQTTKEELYIIEKVWPTATPLASGYSHEEKRDQPNAWINTYGNARVFGTTVGHYNETMESRWYRYRRAGCLGLRQARRRRPLLGYGPK
jgi:hypothetical protein